MINQQQMLEFMKQVFYHHSMCFKGVESINGLECFILNNLFTTLGKNMPVPQAKSIRIN